LLVAGSRGDRALEAAALPDRSTHFDIRYSTFDIPVHFGFYLGDLVVKTSRALSPTRIDRDPLRVLFFNNRSGIFATTRRGSPRPPKKPLLMNPKILVRLSNIIGALSIILLIYWVFVFISIEVFGLKVFRENMTETFYMSILGILALMLGALIINVMFNLTRIAEKHNQDESYLSPSASRKTTWIFALSFPVLFALLFAGDYLTSRKKERILIESARSIIQDHAQQAGTLADYSFSEKWIIATENTLNLLSHTDEHFPRISVIVRDSIDNSKVFLGFDNYYGGTPNDTIRPLKADFIVETTKEEREYLNKVFDQDQQEVRFSAHDGNYELYYPYFSGSKKIVLYFSDYQRYGKMGS
jgi:hypothetical protein